MTREDAAKRITDFIEHFDELGFYDYYKDALDKALDALNGDLGWEFIIFMLEKNYPEDLFGDSPDLGGRTLRAIRWLEKERAALSGWVRTADRVPEAGQHFIPIYLSDGEWATGLIMKAGEDIGRYTENYNWKYWFPVPPLPQPPKEESNE